MLGPHELASIGAEGLLVSPRLFATSRDPSLFSLFSSATTGVASPRYVYWPSPSNPRAAHALQQKFVVQNQQTQVASGAESGAWLPKD